MSKVNWLPLTTVSQLEDIAEQSKSTPCIIFKHSTRCSISSMAKYRLENKWDIDDRGLTPYFLDLIAYREVSNAVMDFFGVRHESPQLLLIRDGRCSYHASHMDIRVQELKDFLSINA